MQPDQTPTPDEGAGAPAIWPGDTLVDSLIEVIADWRYRCMYGSKPPERGSGPTHDSINRACMREDLRQHLAQRLQATVDAHLAAQRPASDGWRPIGSAPRNGTRVLAWSEYSAASMDIDDLARIVWWDSFQECWLDEGLVRPDHLTHWMPLPATPGAAPATDTDRGIATEVERLREALRFYANEKTWQGGTEVDMESNRFNGWRVAREALNGSASS